MRHLQNSMTYLSILTNTESRESVQAGKGAVERQIIVFQEISARLDLSIRQGTPSLGSSHGQISMAIHLLSEGESGVRDW